jgi:LPS export ABC transporter permease LptF
MRLPRTLFRYLAREIIVYGLIAFGAIMLVLISHNLFRRLDDLMMTGFTSSDVWVLLKSLIPMLTAYTVPLAFLSGSLLAIRRIASDREFLAMRSCGIGLRALLGPTLAIAAIIAVLTGYLLISVEHVARRDLLTLFKTVAARGGMFEPGRFVNLSHGVFFVESRDADGKLRGVVISDASNPKRPYRIFAETGTFDFDDTADVIRLRLGEGAIHIEPAAGTLDRYQRVHFAELEYVIDVSPHMRGIRSPVRPKQMTLDELRSVLERAAVGDTLLDLDEKNPMEYRMEIQRRYAMPLAPIVFALLVVPLGVARPRRGHAAGLILCVMLAFLYYAMLSVAQLLARDA